MQESDHQLKTSTAEPCASDHVQAKFVLRHMQHNLAPLSRADKPLQQGSDQARPSQKCCFRFSAVLNDAPEWQRHWVLAELEQLMSMHVRSRQLQAMQASFSNHPKSN